MKGEDVDADDMLAGCPSGYIDLKTGKMYPPDPSKLITMALGFDPADKADCPKWKKFLKQSHKGQEDVIPYIQKYDRLSLTGIMTKHLFLCNRGPGGNGKGVHNRCKGEVVRSYHSTAQKDAFTPQIGGRQGHEQVIAVLQGKRHVTVSEPGEGRRWDMERVKRWTGNEERTRANLMHQNGNEFWAKAKLTFILNDDLPVKSVDEAVRRRMRRIEWPHTPKVVDKDLADNIIAEEGPAVLRWMLDGLADYLKNGMEGESGPPPSVAQATEDYLYEQDALLQFTDDCLASTDNKTDTLIPDIKAVIGEWMLANGITKNQFPVGTFAKKMKDRGFDVRKSGAKRYVRGVRFTAAGEVLHEQAKSRAEAK